MTEILDPPRTHRSTRPRVDKFDARRIELADAALVTLGELGYARTSLREIAQKTDFSHGLLHYYFRDKIELITFCVRRYKEHCVTRYDDIVEQSNDPDALRDAFAMALTGTMEADTAMHRLWYDMRSQAMFEPALRPTVTDLDRQLEQMIWRVVEKYALLRDCPVEGSPAMTYAAFDGLFENALVRHLSGDREAGARLARESSTLLTLLVRG